MANRLRRRTSDQTVLGSNPAVAAVLSPWTRLFTPIVPRRSLHISFYQLSGHPCKICTGTGKKKKKSESSNVVELSDRLHTLLILPRLQANGRRSGGSMRKKEIIML